MYCIALTLILCSAPAPVEAEPEPEPPILPINRASAPWMSISLTAGGAFVPLYDASLRPRAAIGILWDALELGGTAIVGFNFVQSFVGGGVFANWTPVPYRAGYIVYTHTGVGRLHTNDPYLGRRHMDYLHVALGFRIAKRPWDQPVVPWIELGYRYLRRCAGWAMPCEFGGWAMWAPWLEGGVRFR